MSFDEKGLSPVIGVILMVAVTVIMAAVISWFVFGMSENISKGNAPKSFTPIETLIQENATGFMHTITLPCEYCIINQTVSVCYNCSFNKT